MKYRLKVDAEFQSIVPPLSPDEFNQLETNILRDGCREPITIWDNIILDGHNRYFICKKHDLDFKVHSVCISCRDEAIAWICSNQMGRRNITEERRRYLIGKRYESEKKIGPHNANGRNQYSEVRPTMLGEPQTTDTHRQTATKIGNDYHLSNTTVEKYGRYARAIDHISEVNKRFAPRLLTGEVRISYENTLGLAQLSPEQINTIAARVKDMPVCYLDKNEIIDTLRSIPKKPTQPEEPLVTVKNMPAFDPDAEVSSLSLTIPSWCSSISRVHSEANLKSISSAARGRLQTELTSLKRCVEIMLDAIIS